MKIEVCDMCKKRLDDEYYHIPILKGSVKHPGWGKMVLRIGGAKLCKSCAFGIAGVVNGTEEIKFKKKYTTDTDRGTIIKLYEQGLSVKEILAQLDCSETTVRRTIAEHKKAAPENGKQ